MNAVLQPTSATDWAARAPDPFPPDWAVAWGYDEYGLWADWDVRGGLLRMRWIEPGTFWMGSAEAEHGRWDDEGPLHRVRISAGFWLAEVACSQALWQRVMGDNPSHFNQENGGGPDYPVEQVSWHDVQRWLAAMAQDLAHSDWRASLPTEAEWEYACRAGTSTPFWLGEDITPEQVNYDGTEPYRDGPKGLYRRKTMPVRSLAVNPWGLFHMHGNVWEWCADVWTPNYKGAVDVDPGLAHADDAGLGEGSDRVLRGGSWDNSARIARAAVRNWGGPDGRDRSVGWRVALRSRQR